MKKLFFASLMSLKEGVGSGSGAVSLRYKSADPDPHQMTRIPNTAFKYLKLSYFLFFLQERAHSNRIRIQLHGVGTVRGHHNLLR
jgi:hypothetical protein